MSLADALIAGENVYKNAYDTKSAQSDSQYEPQFNAAKLYAMNTNNQYLAPNLQADLYTKQTENQYLPDKLKLANDYQGLINQYYGKSQQADIDYRNEATKLMPLNSAISAQNSIRNNSRFSAAQQFVRNINSMKADDQRIFLSNPENVAARDNAIKTLQMGLNGQQQDNILTPGYLKQFGLGGGDNQPPAPMNNTNPAMQNNPNPQYGLAQPVGGLGAGNTYAEQLRNSPDAINNGIASVTMPQSNQQPNQQASNAPANEPHPVAVATAVKTIADASPNAELSQDDRYQLARQALVNSRVVGTQMNNRAQGAVALERFIQENRDTFAPRLQNAAKYASALGQGQLAVDKLLNSDPNAISDYTWVHKDFIPLVSNNIKVMEKLASSNQQMNNLNSMQSDILNSWYLRPDNAITTLNKMFDVIHKQASATLETAQPIVPGVLEKLNGLKESNGDYVNQASQANKNTASANTTADKGMVSLTTPDGKVWQVPADKADAARARIASWSKGNK